MTLSVDAAQRQSIVPLQQTASSAISRAFDLRFVTGSHYMIKYYNAYAMIYKHYNLLRYGVDFFNG